MQKHLGRVIDIIYLNRDAISAGDAFALSSRTAMCAPSTSTGRSHAFSEPTASL